MFGNRMVYYNGGGGVRRGLIWQSGQGSIEPVPEKNGRLSYWNFYGSLIYGSVNKIIKYYDEPVPFTNPWEHDVDNLLSSVIYNISNQAFNFNFEWTNEANTPNALINANSWIYKPSDFHYVNTGVYNVSNWIASGNSLPFPFPLITFAGMAGKVEGDMIAFGSTVYQWSGDSWSTHGEPYSYARPTFNDGFAYWTRNPSEFYVSSRVSLIGISNRSFLIKNYSTVSPETVPQTHNWRIVKNMIVEASYADLISAPRAYKGLWVFIFNNVVVPEELIIFDP